LIKPNAQQQFFPCNKKGEAFGDKQRISAAASPTKRIRENRAVVGVPPTMSYLS
jgi:hypothetical protein